MVAGAAAAWSSCVGRDFTDVGHAVALVLGMVVSTRFGVPAQWTAPKVGLLLLGSSFGYLVLTDGLVSMVIGAAVGLGSALTIGFLHPDAGFRALPGRNKRIAATQQDAGDEHAHQKQPE